MNNLAKILPFVLGAAISPVLLVMTLYLLSLPSKPIKKTLLYLLSATITIALIAFVIIYSTNVTPRSTPNKDSFAHIIIGLILLGLALWIYKKGPSKADRQRVGKQDSLRFVTIGALLMLTNFTTIAMIFEIAIELRADQITGMTRNLYYLATVLSSIVPIILPLLVLVLAGKNAKRILAVLSSFMAKYSHTVTAAFFALLAMYLLVKPFL